MVKKSISFLKNIITTFASKSIEPFYNIIFGPKRDVEHIWRPQNYLYSSNFKWHIIEKPLQSRGIYLPLIEEKIKNLDKFKTYHNEHLVLNEYMRFVDQNIFNKTFIDIGAGDGVDMSNTFQLVRENFNGCMVELNSSKFAKLSTIYRDFKNISLIKEKITPHNIEDFIKFIDIGYEVDVLNLDIDSYDYFVLEKLITLTEFKFLILEINSIFPLSVDFTVTFDENFEWEENKFQGASISMMYKLLNLHNYSIIHIDRSFVLAVNNNYINNKFNKLSLIEIENTLYKSLESKDNKSFQLHKRFKNLEFNEVVNEVNKLFNKYDNFLIKRSGF